MAGQYWVDNIDPLKITCDEMIIKNIIE